MIVLLGEVGGEEEYKIIEAIKQKRITKPLVAWCIGICAQYITSEVTFLKYLNFLGAIWTCWCFC